MDIIQAIQYMEKNKLVTNCFLKKSNRFMEYWKEGVFREHEVIGDEKCKYICERNSFSMAEILTNSWELIHTLKPSSFSN